MVDTRTVSAAVAMLGARRAAAARGRARPTRRSTRSSSGTGRSHGLLFTVDTLEYLARGGRIGRGAAFAGTLLNVKPILGIERRRGRAAEAGARKPEGARGAPRRLLVGATVGRAVAPDRAGARRGAGARSRRSSGSCARRGPQAADRDRHDCSARSSAPMPGRARSGCSGSTTCTRDDPGRVLYSGAGGDRDPDSHGLLRRGPGRRLAAAARLRPARAARAAARDAARRRRDAREEAAAARAADGRRPALPPAAALRAGRRRGRDLAALGRRGGGDLGRRRDASGSGGRGGRLSIVHATIAATTPARSPPTGSTSRGSPTSSCRAAQRAAARPAVAPRVRGSLVRPRGGARDRRLRARSTARASRFPRRGCASWSARRSSSHAHDVLDPLPGRAELPIRRDALCGGALSRSIPSRPSGRGSGSRSTSWSRSSSPSLRSRVEGAAGEAAAAARASSSRATARRCRSC